MVRANQIDCIIVKDFSRLGETASKPATSSSGCSIISHPVILINDDFDSDQHKGDTGGMDVAFKYLISEYYSRDMSMKTKSAKYAKCSAENIRVRFALMGIAKAPMAEWSQTRKLLRWYSSFSSLRQPALGRPPLPGNCLSGASQPREYKAAHGQQYHESHAPVAAGAVSTVLRILEDVRYIGLLCHWTAGSH